MRSHLILAFTLVDPAPPIRMRCSKYRRIGDAADPDRRSVLRPLVLARCFAQRRGRAPMPHLGSACCFAAFGLVGHWCLV